MKKLPFLLAVAVMLTLSACSSKNKGDSAVQYGSMSADWPSWDSTQSLIESEDADQVLIGKITGISFQITDKRTGHPPQKVSENMRRNSAATWSRGAFLN